MHDHSTPSHTRTLPLSYMDTFLSTDSFIPDLSLDVEVSISSPTNTQAVNSYISEARTDSSPRCMQCQLPAHPASMHTCSGCSNLFHRLCLASPDAQAIPDEQVEDAIQFLDPDLFCVPCHAINLSTTQTQSVDLHVLSGDACWTDHTPSELFDVFESLSEATAAWIPNLFTVPSSKAGKAFVEELTRLITGFNHKPDAEIYSLSAAILAPTLLLQKPSKASKDKEHSEILLRRLEMWKRGEFNALLREGKAVQRPLKPSTPSKEHCEKRFVSLMRDGKLSEATGWLNPERHSNGVKSCTRDVITDLQQKHPSSVPANSEFALEGPLDKVDPIFFDAITAKTIEDCAKSLGGSGGPSGLDSGGIKRILCSRKFGKQGIELRSAVSALARKLATEQVNPAALSIFLASRLIPLEKANGGTRPIGVGETLRRVVTKAIIGLCKTAAKESAGIKQLAAGHRSGCEAAVHGLREHFESPETEAVILLDAENAFNSMNRKLAVHNIKYMCPEVAQFLANSYQAPSKLRVGEVTIMSEEGWTQGDVGAMTYYAMGLMPLLRAAKAPVNSCDPDTNVDSIPLSLVDVFYADDGNAAGRLEDLKLWYSRLLDIGPQFGFTINPEKSYILVKPQFESRAKSIFSDTGMTLTTEGARHLGAAIGSEEYTQTFVREQVSNWVEMVSNLADIAANHPHLAYSNFVSSLKFKWCYLQRTMVNTSGLFEDLERAIRERLIPKIIGRHCNDMERNLLALPIKLGGMGLDNPMETADHQYSYSLANSRPLIDAIIAGEGDVMKIESKCAELRADTSHKEVMRKKNLSTTLQEEHPTLKRIFDLNTDTGASTWLSAKPYKWLGFELSRQEFTDAVSLRYEFVIPDLPSMCQCGKANSSDHALSCPLGGYSIMRHNEVRDCLADAAQHAGLKAVEIERRLLPVGDFPLHPTANHATDARMDVFCVGLWGRFQKSYIDIRIFHPGAPSYRSKPLKNLYKEQEAQKKRSYGRRVIEIEKGTFSPFVLSTSGGLAPESDRILRTLAGRIANRHGNTYREAIEYLRLRIRFSILRACLVSLRGSRTKVNYTSMGFVDLNLI